MLRTLPALLLLVACQPDAPIGPSAGALALGTGEDAWRPFPQGGAALVRGPQGLQHVVVSVRWPVPIETWATDRARLQLRGLREDGVAVGRDVDAGVGLVGRDGSTEVIGVLWVVEAPETVVGERVRLEAEVAPVGDDRRWSGHEVVTVDWASGEPDSGG